MATYWENSCSFGLRYVSWYKCLIVSLVFSHLGFWSGNLFLIAPFPDLCLLVPFHQSLYRLDGIARNCRMTEQVRHKASIEILAHQLRYFYEVLQDYFHISLKLMWCIL